MHEGGEKCLESNSSFVPSSASSRGSNRGFAEGKKVMTYEQLRASGALTPAKPADAAPARSSPAPFASPTTKRSQRAAAQLAERRKTISPKEGEGVRSSTSTKQQREGGAAIGGGKIKIVSGNPLEEMVSTSTLTPPTSTSATTIDESTNDAVNLASDFGEEKDSRSTSTTSRSSNATITAASCFASPPLTGAMSAGRRRFVSSQQKRGGTNMKKNHAASRRSIGGTMTPTSIGDGNGGSERTPLKSLPLSVQREMERKKEAKALSASKSGSDPNFDSRRNLDKRTARLRYSDDFMADLAKHRPSFESSLAKEAHADSETANASAAAAPPLSNGVEIYCRVRPIFSYEVARGEFDVVVIDDNNVGMEGGSGSDGGDVVCINNCMMHADMSRKLVKPTFFPCTKGFKDTTTQDEIYSRVAQPMIEHAARGGISTIFMYGQTGSGKSYTMTGIEERTATGIFDELAAAGNADATVSVQFVELAGKICKDLLGDAGDEVSLAEARDGSVILMNAEIIEVKTPRELAKAIDLGKSRRATEATDVNGVSSRSHAVVQIQVTFKGGDTGKKKKQQRGLLNLLDLAGSERKNDSMYHSSERQKESNEINASLWALKECTRTRALASRGGNNKSKKKNIVIPYRSNNLTRLLRESFERESARLCVIATVAPNATDTEHSMETLRFVSQLVGSEKNIREGPSREVVPVVAEMKKVDIAPKAYSHEQLCAFLKEKKLRATLPKKIDGKALMKMSSHQIRSHIFGGDPTKADASAEIFNALRKENDRVAKLERAERFRVSQARKAGSGYA